MPWITPDDVVAALGVAPTSPSDNAYLVDVTAAANAYAPRARLEAGYVDDVDVVPGPDVKAGTVLYAVDLYRGRGALSGSAAFDDVGAPIPSAASLRPQIMRLLGIPRAAFG